MSINKIEDLIPGKLYHYLTNSSLYFGDDIRTIKDTEVFMFISMLNEYNFKTIFPKRNIWHLTMCQVGIFLYENKLATINIKYLGVKLELVKE